ncbi:MAG: DoxX family protein [Wenzhouxiangella sp.]|jgi:putative oxidoreductase|nr:DoxX family protein [Wenzhouxiangella sp.]
MFLNVYDRLTDRLKGAGDWFAPLGLRLLLAWEFWSAGTTKLGVGSEAPGWFANQDFVMPFGLLSPNMNWFMVTWGEMLAAVALFFGLFTRFFAFSLVVITVVAIAAVHWPASWDSLGQLWEGYSVSRVLEDGEFRGNYRIPLLFLAMTIPLVFWGGGKLSVDHLICHLSGRGERFLHRRQDLTAFALAALIFGLAAVYLIASWGIVLILISLGLFGYTFFGRRPTDVVGAGPR